MINNLKSKFSFSIMLFIFYLVITKIDETEKETKVRSVLVFPITPAFLTLEELGSTIITSDG